MIWVVIDSFRAATTACHVLARSPAHYAYTSSDLVIARLAAEIPGALLVGRPEPNSPQRYHIPNSPTRLDEEDVEGRVVLHRSAAGAVGVLNAPPDARVFLVGFANLGATAAVMRAAPEKRWVIQAMGHEAQTPSLEDQLTQDLLERRLAGQSGTLHPHLSELAEGPGRYFFKDDPQFYPQEDFDRCTALDAFGFAIEAVHREDYAVLRIVWPPTS